MVGRLLVVLAAFALACAPTEAPTPADVPRFPPHVPDHDCPPALPHALPCAPAWIDRCDAPIAGCRTAGECLAALASEPNVCAHGGEPSRCRQRVENALRGGPELGALIDASLAPTIAQQDAARRAIGGMDHAALQRLRATGHDDAFAAIWSARPVEAGTATTESRWSILRQSRDDAFAQLVLEGGESPWVDRVLALGEEYPEDLADAFASKLACHAGRSSLSSLDALLRRWPVGADRSTVRDALQWPDWQLQLVAIDTVVRTSDAKVLPILDALGRQHWSAIVRRHARAASDALRTGVPPRHAIDLDHGVNACRPDPGRPWHVLTRHGPRELGTRGRDSTAVPRGIPSIPHMFGGIDSALRTAEGWYVGTTRWEGEGSLLFVENDGRVEELLRSPVAGFVVTPLGDLALVDDHFGGASVMTLEWVEPTEHLPYERGARVHFQVRLPAGVLGYELDVDGVVTIATQLGVVELDPDGTMKLMPCAAP